MRIRLCFFAANALLIAQVQQPSPRYYTTDQEKHQIYAKLAELTAATGKLQDNPLYPDVAIYQKAGDFILSHPEEFVKASFVKDTLGILDQGIARAKELAAGSPVWTTSKGRLVRAYRSTIDGSLQPYGLSFLIRIPASRSVWISGCTGPIGP
jgi:hypothetical protein